MIIINGVILKRGKQKPAEASRSMGKGDLEIAVHGKQSPGKPLVQPGRHNGQQASAVRALNRRHKAILRQMLSRIL